MLAALKEPRLIRVAEGKRQGCTNGELGWTERNVRRKVSRTRETWTILGFAPPKPANRADAKVADADT